MNAGEQVERIYLANNVYGKQADEIRKIAEQHQVPVNKVPVEKLNSFNVGVVQFGESQGFFAEMSSGGIVTEGS